MEPVAPIFPEEIPPEHAEGKTLVPIFTPIAPNQIFAPGFGGGASYGPMAYSTDTGLLYVNAIDRPFDAGRGPRMFFSAYDPTSGELIWRQIREGYGQAGPVVTSGGVVFVGTGSNIAGYFFAFDARTGEELWRFNTGAGVFSSPRGLHGQRRAVRDRGVGRRRPRAPRRRSHSELRPAEAGLTRLHRWDTRSGRRAIGEPSGSVPATARENRTD